MVKSKRNEGNMIEDVGVIYQQKEKSQRKNNKRSSQGIKMKRAKKGSTNEST
jgi:hypothetical protein